MGVHFDETYAPVVAWPTIRLLMLMAINNGWHSRQIDCVLAYPQAPIERDLYMELPAGVKTKYGNGDTHVLKLVKNLYGQRQAGQVWNQFLEEKLRQIGFLPSKVDPCVYYKGKTIFAVYVDDGIFMGPNKDEIDQAIRDLRSVKLNLEDCGDIEDYVGVHIERSDEGLHLHQPLLIASILEDIGINSRQAKKTVPAASTKILQRDLHMPAAVMDYHYRSVVGKLNYLEKSTRPEIAYAVHQLARLCENPRKPHHDAMIHLCKYLSATKDKGLTLKFNGEHSFEVFADADFCGNWEKSIAHKDVSTAKSRTGYIITYAKCPLLWASKLQTMIALSTTEAEYMALSQSLRDTIPLMNLVKEINSKGFKAYSGVAQVHCKAFEDNTGALELARMPKIRPRTKHINNVYHHFREAVKNKDIEIFYVDTKNQLADIFTKPLAQNLFVSLRKAILHW